MDRILIFSVFFVLLFSSCVPNKKLVYLQKGNELKQSFPKDSVIRIYNLSDYEYRLQPEDILSIRFQTLTEDEYNIFLNQQAGIGANGQNITLGGYLVDREGYIRFPEIGEIKVSGLTIHELEDKLENLARNYVEQPVVKIFLLNYRVTILGEVNGEGTITTNNNRLTIMEAIASAGGLSELADRSKVKIIRQQNGQSSIFYINLLQEELMQRSSFFTHQNDIIIVPPLKQRPFRKYFGPNLGLFVSTVSVLLLAINLISN
ncbi:MAG: polysaccharide biosynthesis/export family protein [Fulvivirga sp.]